jgi:hypothetical protein
MLLTTKEIKMLLSNKLKFAVINSVTLNHDESVKYFAHLENEEFVFYKVSINENCLDITTI